MGFFEDLYSDFGRLGLEMLRAVRLVVDTGIHAKDWSERQAIDYVLENTALSESTAQSEVRRYFVWPGQATSYKIGMITILELRERSRSVLNDQFDIREFHDVVLGSGAVPLPVLERMVDSWIDGKRSLAADS
jgi:uncharacterized protein (DUF885 family)